MGEMGDGMTWWMALFFPVLAAAVLILALWVADILGSNPGARTRRKTDIEAARDISKQELDQPIEDLHKPV